MRLQVEVEVKPTEDKEKVEAAVKKIFPTLEFGQNENSLVGESIRAESLDRLHQLLIEQAIRDSARSVMLRGRRGNVVQFMLNKQVAFVGKVSFTGGESPLGPIVVKLEAPDIERLIDYLAPRTREGKPIREVRH
ncbi:MAG: RNA-binding domain-containing protein [Candidatus Hadarchaeaceae archaeon]